MMMAGSQSRQLWEVLVTAGLAAAVVGCTMPRSQPAASQRTTTSPAVVPAAVAQFSARSGRTLGIASTSATSLQEVVTDGAPHPIARPSTPQFVASADWQRLSKQSAGASHPEGTNSGSAGSLLRRTQPVADEDTPIRLVRLLPSNAELQDGAANDATLTTADYFEPPVPEPLATPPGSVDSEEEDDDPDVQNEVPIDLASVLQITAGQNPQVGFAQQRIQEAYAQLRLAEVLWVPSIRAGANYNKHDGVIQDVAGNMVANSRSSVYTGIGSQAVGAGSPAVPGLVMNFQLRDAIYQPRIAQQVWGARQQARRTVTNDVLLESALRYMDLLEAIQVLAVAEESLKNAEQLSELTKSFAETGEGLQADADRALTELSIRQVEVRRAAEQARVASIRLARVLSQQDQSLTLVPQEPALVPIDLVLPSSQLSELVATGLTNRPELAESRYLVGEAVERLRRELHAPLVPSVLLGLSYGGNGGSPTSKITDFGDRVDFDAGIYWEVRNLGFGEQYARISSQSQREQARWRQVQVMDQVASEVAEAHAQVDARQSQIRLAEMGITAARGSYRRNAERIRDGQGLPIETLQSIQALDQAQRQYVRAVADYNRAQFQLQRALGWPIQ
jgi:outer membrane protein TolC